MPSITLVRFVDIILSISSSDVRVKRLAWLMPAQLTRTSIWDAWSESLRGGLGRKVVNDGDDGVKWSAGEVDQNDGDVMEEGI